MNSIFQFPSSTSVLHITKNIPLCFPHKTRSFGVTWDSKGSTTEK